MSTARATLGDAFDTGHRLLDVDQALLLHLANDLNRLAGAAVAAVRIGTDVDVGTHRLANAAHQLHVACRFDPDLELYRAHALADHLPHLLHPLVDRDQPDGMGDGDAIAHLAAEQLVDGYAPTAAGEIVRSELHRRLGVRVALDHGVHARVQLDEVVGLEADHDRSQIPIDHQHGGGRRLAEVTAEIPAPVLEHRRLSPADVAVIALHPGDDIAADLLGLARELV